MTEQQVDLDALTSKREELIEALAAGVHECDGWMSDAQNAQLEWGGPNRVIHFCGQGSIDVGHLAAIAEAVFEQAHTPTAHECTWACWVDRYGQDHHIPTDDERERIEQSNDIAYTVIEVAQNKAPEEFVTLDFRYGIADALWDAGYRKTRRTAQGEPSDAEVSAFMKTFWEYAPPPGAESRVRAALRAAAAATEVRREGR